MNLKRISSFTIIAALMGFILVNGLSAVTTFAAQSPRVADGDSIKLLAAPERLVTNAPSSIYIVQLNEEPVVTYKGGVRGLKATMPGVGQKIVPTSRDVMRYVNHLDSRHINVLNRAGGGRKLYDYRYSFNGFAAELTEAQVQALKDMPGVLRVTKDELHYADTSSTPTFLGLDAPGGLWEQLGGFGKAGENIIIGIIDSGIWPESPSFSGRTSASRRPNYRRIHGWSGKCVPGENFTASNCNQKLIGARYFNAGWGGNTGIEAQRPWEYNSARDYNGHGTHTASTAGGNNDVPVTGPASVFGNISGIAPRARIAAYKALWSTEDGSTASGNTSDLVAAIDQAVADGVDVINYSVSGTLTNFLDPVQVSFLYASAAGVFVATSAGNSGPTVSTVAHPGPWLTTVAAGTHNRSGEGSVTLGNGSIYYGASVSTAAGPAPLIDSTAAGLTGADPTMLALCYSSVDTGGTPVLDPAKVAGKIVLCDRGVTARVNKSLAVQEAGGVGMILVNTSPNSLNADFHSVPTVHLSDTDRAAVKAYSAGVGVTATIHQSTIAYTTAAPYTASFSSRGPLQAGNGGLLKPDVMAPGQDILAAVAPTGQNGFSFNLMSGTSMSSPHVAGLAALLKDLHPNWSPMMIKSALMTSAYDILDGPNTNPLVIFRQGAGHVKPNSAADPGLVFNAGRNDWFAFLCGVTTGVNPTDCATLEGMGYSLDPSDLNVASIAIGNLAGSQTVVRKVTNVGAAAATYTSSVTGMTGFNVEIVPASLTLNPGETKSFEVTIERSTATLDAYTGGYLTWSDGSHYVRLPVVVKPIALSVPSEVTSIGTATNYEVKFGYDGSFIATARGLVPASIYQDTVTDDPTNGSCSLASPNAVQVFVPIASGITHARFSLFDADVNPGTDLDLCVFRGTTLVGSSGSGTSAEEINLLNPAADTYTVVIQGWNVAGTSPFKLHAWLLGSSSAGNMPVVAPMSASTGATGTINLSFNGLAESTKYMGSIAYSGTTGLPNPTVVRVNTP